MVRAMGLGQWSWGYEVGYRVRVIGLRLVR